MSEPQRPDRCATCRYWDQMFGNGVNKLDPLDSTDEPWGFCRRYPPLLSEQSHESGDTQPRTVDDDWCGEWMPDPKKPVGSGLVMRVEVMRDRPKRGK